MKPMWWWSERDDGRPRDLPLSTLHHEGSPSEHTRTEIAVVRIPRTTTRMTLVARTYQATQDVVLSLEVIRVESPRR